MDVDVSAVPRREQGMEPFEVMTSESQERMLAIVEPGGLDKVLEICARWEIRAAVVGRVTEGGSLRILDGFDGEVLADIPAASLHEDAPLYERPLAPPADLAELRAASSAGLVSDDPGADLLGLLGESRWVWSQYDHQLFLNTVVGPGGDATVLRLKHPRSGEDTGRAMALTTDGNHRWCALDPRAGAANTVAESVLNLACVGARPLALVNCLNFGNPEHPEVMWQLSEAIDGMSAACEAFGVPVIGGNVSLYNESRGSDIDPTPVVGVLGVIDSLTEVPPAPQLVSGGRLILVGPLVDQADGSEWAVRHGRRGGSLPALDAALHLRVAEVVRELVAGGMVQGVHDVSSGGVAAALAEMAVRSGVGFRVARIHSQAELFAEAPSRVVLCVDAELAQNVLAVCESAGVPTTQLGVAMGDRLAVKDLLDIGLDEAIAATRSRLPDALGGGTVQG